ncbi:MAG: DUF552 domain-containing protein [Pseudonocardiaceae bacterium]|nr:DUF552 domain-containing protein [Pseudonocardiaceae bacterium]
MSTLHRLKAYFGMVPAEELDDYDPDYDYHPEYGAEYYDDYPPERPPRRPRHPSRDERDRDAWGRHPRADDGYRDGNREPEPAAVRTARRPGWSPEAPVRGALAVDTAPPMREPAREPAPRNDPFGEEDGHPLGRIVTLHPRRYDEARPIGERYREGMPVIMNLTEMDDADAKRLVDFAAGLAFALRGSIDKVTTKVFLLSPANVDVSAEDRRRIAEGGLFNHS